MTRAGKPLVIPRALVERYRSGELTRAQVATKLGVAITTIHGALRRQGVEKKRGGPGPVVIPPELVERYLAGRLTQAQVAAELGQTESTVHSALGRQGVKKPRGVHPRPDLRERDREIHRLHCVEGWAMARIGRRYGLSRERVRQILTRQGGRTGSRPEAQRLRQQREQAAKPPGAPAVGRRTHHPQTKDGR